MLLALTSTKSKKKLGWLKEKCLVVKSTAVQSLVSTQDFKAKLTFNGTWQPLRASRARAKRLLQVGRTCLNEEGSKPWVEILKSGRER